MAETDWTAPTVTREDPDRTSTERAALEQWVDFHRATLLQKCAGLTATQLKRRSAPPSTLSLLGIVRHMALVERWWFRMHAAQENVPFLYTVERNSTADFEEVDDADAAADLETYRREIVAARAAVAGTSLDLVVPSRGDHPDRTRNVRWIYLHMLEEYARHNGHADLLREAIDGATGD
ncbi:MAG TPA: DinB family protein [Acidimicrobiales bacterium]|nr:DinB family protein [Acidimicrobiales bacterium]